MTKTLIVIPARLASTRLPQKPLAIIHGIPMIVRVWQQALASGLGPVIVACCGPEIANVIRQAGGEAIMTDPHLPSGSDRIVAALNQFDPEGLYDTIINLQGDLPTINPGDIRTVMLPLANKAVDIATLGSRITNPHEIGNPNVVKIAMGCWHPVKGGETARAIYFSRQAIPANAVEFYHHIGIYAYRRQALERYVRLPPSYLEKTEKLEQLRALEDGMRIDVAKLMRVPPSVDTSEDLEIVKHFLGDKSKKAAKEIIIGSLRYE